MTGTVVSTTTEYTKAGIDATFAPRNAAWKPSRAYIVGDLATNGGALYQCTTAHTSGTTFSGTNWAAIASGSGGGGAVTPPTLNNQSGTTYTPTLADGDNVLIRSTNATGLAASLPLNASVPFPITTTIQLHQGAAGPITVSGVSGVSVTGTAATAGVGQELYATKVGVDAWELTALGAGGATPKVQTAGIGLTLNGASGIVPNTFQLTEIPCSQTETLHGTAFAYASRTIPADGTVTAGNATGQIITCQIAGVVLIEVGANFTSGSAGKRTVAVEQNGAVVRSVSASGQGYCGKSFRRNVVAGDTLLLACSTDVATKVEGFGVDSGDTYMTVTYLGQAA